MNCFYRRRNRILLQGFPVVCAVALLMAATVVQALNPKLQIDQYGHDSWTSQRGLPGEAVYQILQSPDGYLWLRTSAGLVRFDGVRFVLMDAAIGTEPVKAICLGADGDLLVRTTSRTIRYRNGFFSDYLPPGPLPDGEIRTIFEDRSHQVFLGADAFIYRLSRNGPQALRGNTGYVHSMAQDREGTLWIAAGVGLYRYQAGVLSTTSESANYRSANALIEDRDHAIVMATNDGLFRETQTADRFEPFLQQSVSGVINTLLEDRQGNLWLGMNGSGVRRLEQGHAAVFNVVDGLTDNRVLSMYEDREGSLWVGTSSGLDRFRDTRLTTITAKDGLRSDSVRSVVRVRDGSLVVFCDVGGLSRIDQGGVTDLSHAKVQPTGGNALFESSDGSLWIGADGLGMTRYKDGKFTMYPVGGRLSKTFISAISEDSESLIVSTSEPSLLRFKDGHVWPFTYHGEPTGLTADRNYTFSIYRDPAGTLWFATVRGLFKVSPGLPPAEWRQKGIDFAVTSISDDGRGSLWLGGRIPGLTRFHKQDGRVTRYTKKDGLFDDYPSLVLPDDSGNLWISTSNGIFVANDRDLDDFADGRTSFVRNTVYGIADGMKTSEASAPTSQPAGLRTPDGKLWFATVKGIVTVDPQHLLHNNLMPPVLIESVIVNGAAQPGGKPVELAPGARSIEFQYTALSLRVPERVKFRYQLQGYDPEWVDAGSRRVAYYTNLPPGTYRFRVMASNDDGLWNETGAAVDLTLDPHFYQTTWFYVLSVLLLLLLAYMANRHYNRLIRIRAEQLSRLVDERTVKLRETQDELELLAHYDALTGLPNRRKFTEDFRAMHAQTKWTHFSLLLIDFDRFKLINDTFGHDAGDAFLVEASRRLSTVVRSTDRVARLGGDEFAILLSGEHDDASIASVCTRVVTSFEPEFLYKGINIMTSASVGVALFPEHGRNQEELYKSADVALYGAKCAGKNNWRIYNPKLQPALSL